jgi:hypothetical protein
VVGETNTLSIEFVRDLLSKYRSDTAGSFRDFELALARAHEIYDTADAELRLRTFRTPHPSNYGNDVRLSMLGILEEEIAYLKAIRVAYAYKLHELAAGISEGLYERKFRIAVLSCRTLYEEAAAAKYYCDQAESSLAHLVSTPPSTFRLSRLKKMATANHAQFAELLDKVSSPAKVLKRWFHVRKVDWSKPDFLEDYKLDEKDQLYPGFFLSAFKTIRWRENVPARPVSSKSTLRAAIEKKMPKPIARALKAS